MLMPGESCGPQPYSVKLGSEGEMKFSSAHTVPAPPLPTHGQSSPSMVLALGQLWALRTETSKALGIPKCQLRVTVTREAMLGARRRVDTLL